MPVTVRVTQRTCKGGILDDNFGIIFSFTVKFVLKATCIKQSSVLMVTVLDPITNKSMEIYLY